MGQASTLDPGDLERQPAADAHSEYAELPDAAAKLKSYRSWTTGFKNWIYAEQRLTLYKSPSLGEVSQPEEEERDFRIRLEHLAREERDRLADKLRKKYGVKITRLQEKVRRTEQKLEKESDQAGSQTMTSALSIGASVLGALFGRKLASTTNMRKVGTAARSIGRIGKERGDVGRAKADLAAARDQLAEMEQELETELEEAGDALDPQREQLDTIEIRPKKTGIEVRLLALCWLPHWRGSDGSTREAWR